MGFHIGLRSFFKTSVLQTGTACPLSTHLEITKKGSCKKQYEMNQCRRFMIEYHESITNHKVHTLLEKSSLFSKSMHLNTNSVVVFEVTHSSAWTVSCPNFFGLELVDSTFRTISICNVRSRLVTIYVQMRSVSYRYNIFLVHILWVMQN